MSPSLSPAAARLLAVVADHFGPVMILRAASHAAGLSTAETRAAAHELARLGLVIYTKRGPRRSRLRLTDVGADVRRQRASCSDRGGGSSLGGPPPAGLAPATALGTHNYPDFPFAFAPVVGVTAEQVGIRT